MGQRGKGIARVIWDGPFYIGPLAPPVSVGDVLLKILETVWRAAISILVIGLTGIAGILGWTELASPILFPPLASQVQASAIYDDGANPLPPALVVANDAFRCTSDFPLRIAFSNKSNRTIGQINFSIKGTEPGRTSNVVQNSYWEEADAIIPPGHTWTSCWSVSVPSHVQAGDLLYTVEILGAEEADANESRSHLSVPIPPHTPMPSTSPNSPEPTPTKAKTIILGTLRQNDWERIGMGCACAFTSEQNGDEKLIAGGDGVAFFRPKGEPRYCAAPDIQSMFSGPTTISCGQTDLQITPYGEIAPGLDGHSTKARLTFTDASGSVDLTGRWSCAC